MKNSDDAILGVGPPGGGRWPETAPSTAGDVPSRGDANLWRTAIHEAGHVCCSRYLNLEVAGSTIVEGPSYSGVTWGPGSARALRGKAAYDDAGSAAHDAVAGRVADRILRFMPGPGEPRVDDVFSGVQACTIELMAGGAAEKVFFGDAPPKFMASDMLGARAIAGVVCQTPASVTAFVEHCFQEALVINEENRPVVFALAQALVDHPERTLNGTEIDAVISSAIAAKLMEDEMSRRRRWRGLEASAALLFEPTTSEHRHAERQAERRAKVSRALRAVRAGNSISRACREAGLRGHGAQKEVRARCALLGLPRFRWQTTEPFPGRVR